ncbi:MAG: GIY-YIG nuclease family protein [Bacteroidia bacterium]
MFTVYVLHSESSGKIYIGFTSDLEQRIKSHNEVDKKGWTKNFRPWKVTYTETYDSKQEAMKREKELKSSRGRAFIRNQVDIKLSARFISVS